MSKKKLTERGLKIKANKLISQFLGQIAEEQTEFAKDDCGNDQMVSKAEALARKMWKMALGYKEEHIEDDGSKTIIHHPPDRVMMSLLFDRIEGKAPLSTAMDKGKRTIADKVTEQGKKRIEQAGNVTS